MKTKPRFGRSTGARFGPGEGRRRVYQAVVNHWRSHGLPPVTREVADAIGMALTAVYTHLERLRIDGRLEYGAGGPLGNRRAGVWLPGLRAVCRAEAAKAVA